MSATHTDPPADSGRGVHGPVSGAYALARLIADKTVDVGAVSLDDPLLAIVERVAAANGHGALAVYIEAIKEHPDRTEIMALVRQVDTEGVSDAAPGLLPTIPELPEDARPDPDLAAEAAPWLDHYINYCESVSPMTPRLFHESGALWLIATLIARRLMVPMPFGDIFPNIYVIWIAQTTVFHKTTAMAVPRTIARQLFPHLLAPQEVTPEAFLSDMAGKEPTNLDQMPEWARARWEASRHFSAQRSLIVDEISGLLASAGREYNAGLIEAFLRFYDCEPHYERSTRGQGLVMVRNACVSMLGASTPRALAPHLSSELLWSNGYFPRHGLLTPDVRFPRYARPTNDGRPPGDRVTWPLKKLYRVLPMPAWPDVAQPLRVRLGAGVIQKWEAFNKVMSYDLLRKSVDEQFFGTYGRMPTQVIKLATLLAAIDWVNVQGDPEGAPQIELPHLHRALVIAESWRSSAHRAVEQGAVAEENIKLNRLMRQVGKVGSKGISIRELRLAMRDVSASEIKLLVDLALDSGQIVEVAPDEKRGPGQPTKRFRIAFT